MSLTSIICTDPPIRPPDKAPGEDKITKPKKEKKKKGNKKVAS